MKPRRDRLAMPASRAAIELGFALARLAVEDPTFRDALTVGFTTALRAHAAGTLADGGGAAALAEATVRFEAVHRVSPPTDIPPPRTDGGRRGRPRVA